MQRAAESNVGVARESEFSDGVGFEPEFREEVMNVAGFVWPEWIWTKARTESWLRPSARSVAAATARARRS